MCHRVSGGGGKLFEVSGARDGVLLFHSFLICDGLLLYEFRFTPKATKLLHRRTTTLCAISRSRAPGPPIRPSGILVFSTHHPIHQASLLDSGYLCTELIEEEWVWLGEKMRYYRRPLRDLTEPLTTAGFVIERISEPTPSEALKTKDPKGYDLLCRLPAFIFVRARKMVGRRVLGE